MTLRAIAMTSLLAICLAGEAGAAKGSRQPLVRMADFVSVRRHTTERLAAATASPAWRTGRTVRRVEHDFTSTADPDAVWRVITTADPKVLWRSGVTTFRLAFGPGGKQPLTGWTGLREGTTLFLDLHGCPFPMCDEAIGLRITRVDPRRREVTFRYTDVAPVIGEQTLRVEATPTGTRVHHVSEFSARSRLTDLLYRPFHRLSLQGLYGAVFRAAGG